MRKIEKDIIKDAISITVLVGNGLGPAGISQHESLHPLTIPLWASFSATILSVFFTPIADAKQAW
jgi:hypothetical protein